MLKVEVLTLKLMKQKRHTPWAASVGQFIESKSTCFKKSWCLNTKPSEWLKVLLSPSRTTQLGNGRNANYTQSIEAKIEKNNRNGPKQV